MTPAAQILTSLREAEHGVSSSELCQQLKISRAAVWSHIESLRETGFQIIASPHRGYQLISSPEQLVAEDLQSRLAGETLIGRRIKTLQTTSSTNDEIEKAAQAGETEGLVVFAESQNQGRGRLGRKWSSPAGRGLWFSVLLRPALTANECTQLTAAAAVSLARAIRQTTGIRPGIKWPNDLQIEGRKVAGILTEMSAEIDHVRHVILGIGIDVNQTASDFTGELSRIATSLKLASGKTVDRTQLAEQILRELDADYQRILDRQFPAIAEEWAAHCTTLGKEICVDMGPRQVSGRAEALDESGALLIRTQHGRVERVMGGDVTLTK